MDTGMTYGLLVSIVVENVNIIFKMAASLT